MAALEDYDWDGFADGIEKIAKGYYEELFGASYDEAKRLLPIDVSFDQEHERVQETLEFLGKRIRGVAETTKAEVGTLVGQGAQEGWSSARLAKEIRAHGEISSVSRSQTIARTESATAYNLGSLMAYEDADVGEVLVLDGEGDEVCASVNGTIQTLEWARDNPIGHPGCTRAFVPQIEMGKGK
jgi:hypothetical protein